ncbi:glycosyltransferase [Kribbella deserti]|uniref:Glycosyltransferase n=1 Tax=Kribbella deserti TaxID=1926257 RepID=A0ABV6QUL0_9ACTN
MTTPRLSVVVPFFNVRDYFRDCLDSIARQTYADFEAILVDDGSQDGSALIAKEFCEKDSRFRLISQQNQGPGPARNDGVGHARGEFLAFVDSDDLITRHAYEMMIRTLDESGSSFVAGNARRFNNSSGVRQSWVHRAPFAKNLTATHLLETPELIVDRMIWNKVYRLSFWREFGLAFPPIQYEDYPVMLQAHLDAVSVDCVSVPVYYWRERESGESITQQKFKYSNLVDRVISAEMVVGMIDERAPQLRPQLHNHLVQVDLAALSQAFATVPPESMTTLVELGQRLLKTLDDESLATAPRFDQLQIQALRDGDAAMLRTLAQFRADGGTRDGGRAAQRPGRPWQYEFQYPGRTRRSMPRELYRVPADEINLATTVTHVRWHDETLVVRGTAQIRHLRTSPSSKLRIDMVIGDDRLELPLERFDTLDSNGDKCLVGYEFRVGPDLLAKLPIAGTPVIFDVELRSGRLTRGDELRGQKAGSASWSPGRWVHGGWIQPAPNALGNFTIKRVPRPHCLTSAEVDGDDLVITGSLPPGVKEPRLSLTRTLSGADAEFELDILSSDETGSTFRTRIPMAPIVDSANPDDPFTQRTSRGVRIHSAAAPALLLWTGPEKALTTVYRDRLLILTRSPGNFINLHESPVRVVADGFSRPAPDELVLEGPLAAPAAFTWRRFLEDSDDHVDVPCRLVVPESGRWTASVDLSDLMPDDTVQSSLDPLANLAEWILFAINEDGSAYAVQSEAFLTSRLPLELRHSRHDLVLTPRAGTLHLEVR